MNQVAWKNWIPHILTVLLFLIISGGYFSPALGGDILVQGDIANYQAVSKEARDYRAANKEEPLWTNSLFGGMPAYQVSMKNPGNLFIWMRKIVPRPISFLFVSMIGGWLMMLAFGANRYVALVGGLAYGLTTYLITFVEAGHNSKSDAVAWMPFVIAGVHLLFKGKLWQGAALAALGMVMEVTVNHLQITYYLLLMIGIWSISELIFAIKEDRIVPFAKSAGILVLVVLIGIGASSTRILTTLEYSDWTIRGASELTEAQAISKNKSKGLDREYAFAWSYGVQESMTLMFPNFAGGGHSKSFLAEGEKDSKSLSALRAMSNGSNNEEINSLARLATKYWGVLSFTSGPVYVGAIICFLFFLGCFLVPPRFRWWLLAVTILSFVLSWGKNFPGINNLLFEIMPGYNKFRTVMMAFIIADLSMMAMAMLALNQFLFGKDSAERKKRALYFAGGISTVLFLYVMSAGALYNPLSPNDAQVLASNPQLGQFMDALASDRTAMIRADGLRTFGFIAIAFGLLFVTLRGTIKPIFAIGGIGLLIFVDLISVDLGYVNKDNFQPSNYYERSFNQQLPVINDKDPHFRVYNTNRRLDQDGVTSFKFKSIGGYHGAKSRRFQDIVDRYKFNLPLPILNMLNTKYVIGQQNKVQRNPQALGNAWLVNNVVWAESADEEIASLDTINVANAVVIRTKDKELISAFNSGSGKDGTISLTNYSPNEMTYNLNLPATRMAVFSEMFYRGNEDWKAYLDGEPVDHVRANYILRAMTLPAGQHELVFKFDPPAFKKGVTFSLISSILAWLIIFAAIFQQFRKAKNERVEETIHSTPEA